MNSIRVMLIIAAIFLIVTAIISTLTLSDADRSERNKPDIGYYTPATNEATHG